MNVTFRVINVTKDRRSTELQKRGEDIERARADAVLDIWTAQRQPERVRRQRAALRDRARTAALEFPFRRQAL